MNQVLRKPARFKEKILSGEKKASEASKNNKMESSQMGKQDGVEVSTGLRMKAGKACIYLLPRWKTAKSKEWYGDECGEGGQRGGQTLDTIENYSSKLEMPSGNRMHGGGKKNRTAGGALLPPM